MNDGVFIVPEERHGEAAALFAAALDTDAGVAMVRGGLEGTKRWFEVLIGVVSRGGGIVLGVEHAGALAGVLLLDTGGRVRVGAQCRAILALIATVGVGGLYRLARHDRLRRGTMGGRRSVVEFVAVDSATRGRGVARMLFAAAQQHREGRVMWLDTTKPENVAIFAALGFVTVGEFVDGGVRFTAMEKDPTA